MVLRVDIDGDKEIQIVLEIASCIKLDELVDEILFEYYLYNDGENFGWGKDPNPGHKVDDAF